MHIDSPHLVTGPGGNGSKAFRCTFCSTVVSTSDRLIIMNQTKTHNFTNPAGVQCRFHTFGSCPGALGYGLPIQEDTWFPGYQWSLALCRHCRNHLGWLYEAVSAETRPPVFWGILIQHIKTAPR